MEKRSLAVMITIAFSVLGVLGDYFLKRASAHEHSLKTIWFYIGFTLYASTAFGWVLVMKHLKLATIGIIYSVSMVLLLTTIGVVFFREPLNAYEIAGLVMAIASLLPAINPFRVAVQHVSDHRLRLTSVAVEPLNLTARLPKILDGSLRRPTMTSPLIYPMLRTPRR